MKNILVLLVCNDPLKRAGMLVYHKLHLPCLVYKRERANRPYVFSHACRLRESIKPFPVDLRVTTLLVYRRLNIKSILMRQPVLVLVSGDVGKCVNLFSKEGTQFLFCKSPYDQKEEYEHCVEFDEEYVHCEFYSTLAMYVEGRLQVILGMIYFFTFMHTSDSDNKQGINEIQSSVVLIPKVLKNSDISLFQKHVKHSISKSLDTSLFVCNMHVYKEDSLQLKVPQIKDPLDENAGLVKQHCTLGSAMATQCVAA